MQSHDPPGFREHPIEWTDEKVARLWDYYSRVPGIEDIYFSRLHGRRLLEVAELDLGARGNLLDFGCGPGFMWDHLRAAKAQLTYTGLDFSPQSVQQLNERARGEPLFAGARHVARLPSDLMSASYNAILVIEVLEHLKDDYLDVTLRELARLLADGGRVVITVPNDENLGQCTKFCPECGSVFHEWQHVRTWTAATLAAKMKDYGFELCFSRTLDFSAAGLLGRLVSFARGLWLGRNVKPHLIAVFSKGRK